MLLTRIWGVILACLATFFLAGMFLVASSGDEDFTDADEAAIRAIAEAGTAALDAQFVRHPVQQTQSILYDSRVQVRLNAADDAVDSKRAPLGEIIAELTEDLRVRHGDATLTVALLDSKAEIKAANGAAKASLPELLAGEAVADLKSDAEVLFSVMLDGKLHVCKVSKPDSSGHRVLGLGELDTGAGSAFRRVLGSSSPAALIRKGKLVGAIIGDQPVTAELEALGKAHVGDTPSVGASKAFQIGTGMDARIGALGRIPGPAGRGDDGLVLAVLSGKTAAAGKKDLATVLRRAREDNGLTTVNLVMLIGLLVVTAGLAVYLPTLEGTGPLGRLTREFHAMAGGAQHGLFHDSYSGPWGNLARSANAAHEGLRAAYVAELEGEEGDFEANATAPRSKPSSERLRRATRGHRRADTGQRTSGRKHLSGKRRRSSKARSLIPETPPEGAVGDTDRAAPLLDDRPPEDSAPAAAAPVPAPVAIDPPAPVPAAPAAVPPAPQAAAPAAPPSRASQAPAEPSGTRPIAEPSLALQIDEIAPGFLAPPPAVSPAPQMGDVAAASSDPTRDYYLEVYEEFMQVKEACGEAITSFTFEKFSRKLSKQTAEIKKKRPGVADVRFTVYVKDGKAALRAKVIKA